MANATINDDVIAKEFLVQLENSLVMGNLVFRDHEAEFGETKKGSTVRIRRPVQYTVREGATINLQDTEEATVTLTIDKQMGVDWYFSSKDLTLTIDQFSERYIKPAAIQLANQVDTDLLNLYTRVYNSVGTPGAAFDSYADYLSAVQRAQDMAMPMDGNVHAVMNSTDYYALVGVLPGLESGMGKGLTALEKATLGELGGIPTYMTQNMKTHTWGTANAAGAVDGDNQNVTYAASKNTWTQDFDIKAVDSGDTIEAGDVFTIASVYAVNPVSKSTLQHLQQFTVIEDQTGTGTTRTLTISPPIITSGPHQTVSAVPADSADITMEKEADTAATYRQNLMFHRNAFALAMVPMELPEGAAKKARQTHNGLSIRMVGDYDITNDRSIYRTDILYGVLLQDPRLALRFHGA